jgi:hypothetical protein
MLMEWLAPGVASKLQDYPPSSEPTTGFQAGSCSDIVVTTISVQNFLVSTIGFSTFQDDSTELKHLKAPGSEQQRISSSIMPYYCWAPVL